MLRRENFRDSVARASPSDLKVERNPFAVDQHRPGIEELLTGAIVFVIAAQRRKGKEELHRLGLAAPATLAAS